MCTGATPSAKRREPWTPRAECAAIVHSVCGVCANAPARLGLGLGLGGGGVLRAARVCVWVCVLSTRAFHEVCAGV